MILELNEIDTNTEEGRLLLVAIAKITTSTHTDKTPNEVIAHLRDLSIHMFSNEPYDNGQIRGSNATVDPSVNGEAAK